MRLPDDFVRKKYTPLNLKKHSALNLEKTSHTATLPHMKSPEESILSYLSSPEYVPAKAEDIVRALSENRRDAKHVKRALNMLLTQGHIVKVKQDRYCIPTDADLITGKIRLKRNGGAVVFPDPAPATTTAKKTELPPVIQIRPGDASVALPGDKVMVRLVRERPNFRAKGRRQQASASAKAEAFGRVIRIVERARNEITGTLTQSRIFYYVVPDDPTIGQDILVPDPATHTTIFPQPREGDKVVVKIVEWKNRHNSPVGEITEVLGKSHTPDAEFKAILRKYRLHPDFPEAVLSEAAKMPDHVGERDLRGRMDCRSLFTLTIDPQDAKDFDDALSIESLPNGTTRVGVHIADVSAYVRRGSALDKEAYERGNSTYLVGMVIPMLPYALSNGLCSLVENEDRLTKSVFFTFSQEGRMVGEPEMANTVIRSTKRLSYEQAYALMFNDDLQKVRDLPVLPAHQTGNTGRPIAQVEDKQLRDIQQALRTLWGFAEKIRKARMSGGSLDLTTSEVKIYVDADGYADRIEAVSSDESHDLIEEYMLLANEAVARAFHAASLPYISRVHDLPDEEKLDEYREYLANFGIQVGDLNNRREVVRTLRRIKDHPQSYALKIAFLRSLKQACYRASADGHYGLNKLYYAHFTSPIRRYSDLIAHRIFDTFLERKRGTTPKHPYGPGELETISAHISQTERNSADAERESVKVKLLEFFEREAARKEKRDFDAVITDVRNFGFFVELTQSQAYGLVPASSLQDDIYQLTGDGLSLIGRRTQRIFTLGATVPVQVYRVDRFKREIDFTVAAGAVQKISGTAPMRKPVKGMTAFREQMGQSPQKGKRYTGRGRGPGPKGRPQAGRAHTSQDKGAAPASSHNKPKPHGQGRPSNAKKGRRR